eukprot:1719146-Pyramimonas_sp.AAC.3
MTVEAASGATFSARVGSLRRSGSRGDPGRAQESAPCSPGKCPIQPLASPPLRGSRSRIVSSIVFFFWAGQGA